MRKTIAVFTLALTCAVHPARAQEPPPIHTTVLKPTPAVPVCNEDRLKNDPLRRLTPKQRLCIYYHDVTAPSAVFGAVAVSGFKWATNHEDPRFGTGFSAFLLGTTTRYAQSATKSTAEYMVDWAMNQDPRGSRHHGSIAHRMKSAAASLFVTSDEVRMRFKPGPLVGAAAGGFIALTWEERNKQSVDDAFEHMGTSLAGSLAGAEFREFAPAIMRWVTHLFEPKLK